MADAPAPPPSEPSDYNPGAAQQQQASSSDSSGLFGVSSGQGGAAVGASRDIAAPRYIGEHRRPTASGTPDFKTATLDDMSKTVNGLKPDALKALQVRLFNAGFYGTTKVKDITFGVADEQTQDAWNQLLSRNARGVAAGNKTTWQETLSEALKGKGVEDPTKADGKFQNETSTNVGSKTGLSFDSKTGLSLDSKSLDQVDKSHDVSTTNAVARSHTSSTSSDTKFSDPVTAHALIVKAMQDKLGRDPTDGELGSFRTALHAYEQANPAITQTTQDQTKTSKETTETTGQKRTREQSTDKGSQNQQTGATDSSTSSGTTGQKTSSGAPTGTGSGTESTASNQATNSSDSSSANSSSNQVSNSTDATTAQNSTDSFSNANTTSDENTTQSQNSTESGGTNPADWSQFYVQEQNRPEMDEYHKATMYYNAALQVLGLGGGH